MTAFGGVAMWRLVLAVSLLLTLAFGAVADAKCAVCLETAQIQTENGGTTLRFTARSMNGQAFPETGTAVVMQFDGNRGKCLNVSLVRTGVDGDRATYVGRFDWIYKGAVGLAGRVDLGGSIYDFSAPIDGTPGTIGLASYQGSIAGQGAAPIVAPQPVTITPDPATIDPRLLATAAPEPVSQPAYVAQPVQNLFDGLSQNSVGLLGLIVVVVAIVSAYLDRKRSLARATAG